MFLFLIITEARLIVSHHIMNRSFRLRIIIRIIIIIIIIIFIIIIIIIIIIVVFDVIIIVDILSIIIRDIINFIDKINNFSMDFIIGTLIIIVMDKNRGSALVV